VDPTYATAIAILRRIFRKEADRVKKIADYNAIINPHANSIKGDTITADA
jgi:hypothetical protein